MDIILFDPDVAYLILVGGVLLTLFALVTPGSGILEFGALFLLTLGLSIVGVIIGSAYLFRGDGWLPSVNIWLVIIVSLPI